MNAKELADALGVHAETVRRMIREGQIEAEREGREYIIPKHEIDRLLKNKDVSDRHKDVVKSAYVVVEQIEVLAIAELSKLLKDVELFDFYRLREKTATEMAANTGNGNHYVDFMEWMLDEWKEGKNFSDISARFEKLNQYKQAIETIKETQKHSETYSNPEEIIKLTKPVRKAWWKKNES